MTKFSVKTKQNPISIIWLESRECKLLHDPISHIFKSYLHIENRILLDINELTYSGIRTSDIYFVGDYHPESIDTI